MKKRIETALLLLALALQWDLGARIAGEGYDRYRNMVTLLLRGEMLPRDAPGAGYSIIFPILASPLYELGDALVPYFNLVLFTIALVLGWFALRDSLGESRTRRFLLLLLLATTFTQHLQTFSAEVAASLLCAIGLWGVAHEKKWGWIVAVIGCVSTPALLLPLALVSLLEKQWWPPLLGALLFSIEALIGEASFSGLHAFSNPFFGGVFEILFSLRKGLVFFVPALFLPAKAEQRWHRLMLLFVAGMVLVYAKWWNWSGDPFWGPRFFLFASIPAALALATRRYSLLTLGVALLSLWVGLDGAAFADLGSLWRLPSKLDFRQSIRVAFWLGSAALLWVTRERHLDGAAEAGDARTA